MNKKLPQIFEISLIFAIFAGKIPFHKPNKKKDYDYR